jgi:hypothetical protein
MIGIGFLHNEDPINLQIIGYPSVKRCESSGCDAKKHIKLSNS